MPRTARYDAFISYSHALDGALAPTLQAGIERFAKPWYRPRVSRVFRDDASLSANPGLWSSIVQALESSRWLVLMASPQAASSVWVEREVAWWRANRSPERLLIVLTDGELVWDERSGQVDWEKTNALPPALRGAFAEEPRWVDLRWLRDADQVAETNPRLRECVADIAAAVREVPKDLLVGEHIRQHRRTMRLARSAVTTLVVLLVATMVGALVAVNQRNQAREQARIATARQLAATSGALLDTRLDLAQLFAVHAYRLDPSPQTKAALFQSVTSSPHLVRYLPMGAQVAELSGSGDGRTVVAGLSNGRVVRWNLAEPNPHPVFALDAAISSLAVSRDGSVIVASDGSDATLWQQGRPVTVIRIPPGQKAGAVALSPSGRTAVVHASEDRFGGLQSITIFDVSTRRIRATHDAPHDPEKGLTTSSSLVAASDDELLLLDGGYGGWQRRRIADWALADSSRAAFGVHNYAVAVSSDGGSFTETNGASTIPVWRTNGPTDYDHPGFTAQAPISNPRSLALSRNGAKLAVADSGIVYVAPVAREGASRPGPVQLVGNGSINPDGVRFFGDGSHLLSASGDKVALWDLGQQDRIARTARTAIRPSCNACPGPLVAVAPDGRQLAAVDGSGTSAVIQALDDGSARPLTIGGATFAYTYGPPVWDAAGRHLALPVSPPAGGSGVSAPGGLPPNVRAWPAGEGSDFVATAGRGGDGRTVILVTTNGQIRIHDLDTGALRKTVPGPPSLAGETGSPGTAGSHTAHAAVDPTSSLVAFMHEGSVIITDSTAGQVVGTVRGSDPSWVTFSGPRLLVQRTDGALEVWDRRGSTRERVLPGDESYSWPPAANQQGTLVARQRSNGSIVLADLDNGNALATFLPASGSLALKTGLAFTPDGTQLIALTESADVDTNAQLVRRDISDENLVRTACQTAGRDPTPAEWQAFVGTDVPDTLACQ
jgi:WD40 repeat protein